MLHILNGASTEDTLSQTSIQGDLFSFRDVLINGPTPSDVSAEEWRRIRAEHLAEGYGLTFTECEKGLLSQESALESFSEHEEVVLWFEHDLFCQTNLFYLLNRFAGVQLGKTKLSLICIGEFPGKENFRGLGELNAEQLTTLFHVRETLTDRQLELGQLAWQAYCSSDPTAIEQLLKTDTSPLPFLKDALEAHLKRFPSIRNGLGQIENRGLDLIHEGLTRFTELFPRFVESEPVYGLGDAQFYLALRQLSMLRQPLLTLTNGNESVDSLDPEGIRRISFDTTETGLSVLRGEADRVALNGIDQWLGGVHLSEENLWRWDETAQNLVKQ